MIKPKNWLIVAILSVTTGFSFGQTRYVSTTGTDLTNDCTLPGNPCATIQNAVSEAIAGDSILIGAGTYNLTSTLLIDKNDLVLSAQVLSNKPVITTTASDVISLDATGVYIRYLRFEMGLTPTTGLRGVVSNNNFDDLWLDENEFISTKTISTGMVFGAYAVSLTAPFGTNQSVSLIYNEVSTLGAAYDFFGRGFSLGGSSENGARGFISENTIMAYYPIQAIRATGNLMISSNILQGITMINSPINNAILTLQGNTFDGVAAPLSDDLYSLVDIRGIEDGTVNFKTNSIINYTNIGVLSMASQNVNILDNVFTPNPTATNFVSLMANTKLMTNGVQSNTYSDQITIEGNTFDAGASAAGQAIVFADHYGANTPAFVSNTKVGGSLDTQQNTFDSDLGQFIHLDDQTGASTAVALWAIYPVTTMSKVSQDVVAYAVYNDYGLTTIAAIEAMNYDKLDDIDLGKVVLLANGINRYVAETGSDLLNDCTLPGNPCATIEFANILAVAGDSIIVSGGDYVITSTVSINKDGVVLIAEDLNDRPEITATTSSIIEINAEDVEVRGFIFKMGLTASNGLKGITSTSTYDNAMIAENDFISIKPLLTGMSFGAYAIELNSATGSTVNSVTISDNLISAESATNDNFGRGIGIGANGFDGPKGTVDNNDVTAYYPIQAVNNGGDVLVANNTLNGMTMIGYPLNNTDIDFDNNTFDGGNETSSAYLYALADVRAIDNGSVSFTNNTFQNYQNIGLLSMASQNVTVDANTFTPLATATSFVSVMANTKLMTNGTQTNTTSDEIFIKGNTFDAGLAGNGTAIIFADHYGVNAQPFVPGIVVGGPTAAEQNVFSADLKYFIQLDSLVGPSTSVTLWSGYAVTTMKPFSQNVEALMLNNDYNLTDLNEIELQNIDSLDNAVLGKVILSYTTSVGVEDVTVVAATIYPNPASDAITVTLNNNDNATLEIVDMLGNVVKTANMNAFINLTISDLNAGVYIVKLTVENQEYTSRIVKK